MTLLDISKLKNKEDTQSTSQSSSAPETKVSESAPSSSDSVDVLKIKKLLVEANEVHKIDLVQAESKYDEIKIIYAKLSQDEKSKVHVDCLNLFNLLSK